MKIMFYATLAVSLFLATTCSAQTPGEFEIRFTQRTVITNPVIQAEVDNLLDDARDFWEARITGYQPGVTLDGIDVFVDIVDEPSTGMLGGAVPGIVEDDGTIQLNTVEIAGYTFATNEDETSSVGTLILNLGVVDPFDFEDPTDLALLFQTTARHELAHAIGFQAVLWEPNGVYQPQPGIPLFVVDPASGEYTGSAGVRAYRNEFDFDATFVPIELSADSGTNNNHLDEEPSGLSLTGITDIGNRDFGDRDLAQALMTGFPTLDAPETDFLTNTSVATFVDIGYTVSLPNAVLGDFSAVSSFGDGDVDINDNDFYAGSIGQPATSGFAQLDLNGNGIVDLDDRSFHIETLIETQVGKGALLGDLNLDGTVNTLGDAFTLVGNLAQNVDSYADGDIDGDGFVTMLGDAMILVGNLGQSSGP